MKTKTTDLQTLLKKTGRTLYVNDEVLKTAPNHTQEGELEFFTLNKRASTEEVAKEYESRGLEPATIATLCVYDKVKREVFDEKKFIGTQWKDAEGQWCFAAFCRWLVGRDVDVNRRGSGWCGSWWFAGVRKSLSTKSSDTLTKPLETYSLDLELAIKKVKEAGLVVYKLL